MTAKVGLWCLVLISATALTYGQTCLKAGQCQGGHHIRDLTGTDPLQCLEKCKQQIGCNSFTFIPGLNFCELFSDCTQLDTKLCSDCISGDVSCYASEPVCFVPGECQGVVDHLEETTSHETCLDLCKLRDGCNWFTYHNPSSACILYRSCDSISTDCSECVSGESGCETGTTTDGPPVSTTPAGHYVYLVGGSSSYEGNVYAYNPANGVNGPVCDDLFWDLTAAKVVCKQLGFRGAEEAFSGSHFGEVSGDYSYDDVSCSGSEATLDECDHYFPANCFSDEGAGVRCIPFPTTTQRPTTSGPSSHYVYLVGGSSSNEGNVFALNPITNVNGPVCDDLWGELDAAVVCRQLGFSGVANIFTGSHFGTSSDEFSYDDLQCEGTESNINQCAHAVTPNCESTEIAGIQCSGGGETTTDHITSGQSTTTDRTTSGLPTTTGKYPGVTLVGGSNEREGNVFTTNPETGVYGPICDDHWTLREAGVVCHMLGFQSAYEATTLSEFGDVPEEFAMDSVYCDGDEETLFECVYSDENDCSVSEGAGVICNP